MILAAVLERPETDDLVLRVATAKAYFKPHMGMLALADRLLHRRALLVDLVRSVPFLTRIDEWGPVAVTVEPVPGPATVSADPNRSSSVGNPSWFRSEAHASPGKLRVGQQGDLPNC